MDLGGCVGQCTSSFFRSETSLKFARVQKQSLAQVPCVPPLLHTVVAASQLTAHPVVLRSDDMAAIRKIFSLGGAVGVELLPRAEP